MVAALSGRSGKTVITLGLIRLLTRRGLVVQPFKKGLDFIDPGWHRAAGGRVSRNLDSFLMTPEQILSIFSTASEGSDISIIEGAMGLFDGLDAAGSSSSAQIAKITQTPVILVLNPARMTRTAAALVLGCQQFDPEVHIAGVILNKVRGARHEKLIRECIESTCGIPVLGAIPTDERLIVPDRHLGLLSSEEAPAREQLLNNIADAIEEYVDIESFITMEPDRCENTLIRHSGLVPESNNMPFKIPGQARNDVFTQPDAPLSHVYGPLSGSKIAVIRDQAFCFYYEENLEALRQQGAELVFVNSLEDQALPKDIQALYIGGGFPEVFAAELEANKSFRADLKSRIEAGLRVHAEGGGLMYLGRTLHYQDKSYEMVGALQLDTAMQSERQAHGYAVIESTEPLPNLPVGTQFKGHAYHHFKIINASPDLPTAFKVLRGQGIDGKRDGFYYKGVLATTMHKNALATPSLLSTLTLSHPT